MYAFINNAIRMSLAVILAGFPASLGNAYNAYPAVASQVLAPAKSVAEPSRCAASPLGEVTVATLGNTPIVTLSANGHPVILLLDTGAERTILVPAVAERIGAEPPRIEFQRRVQGIAGTLPSREVELRSFAAGNLSFLWRRIVVASVTIPGIFTAPLDGLLGRDVLSDFDIDLDLPHQRMSLYRKGSCPNGPPWAGAAIAASKSPNGYLFFPVGLDNRKISAIFDTGAQRSVLSETVARSIGITEALLARDRPTTTRGAAGERLNSHIHRFSELKIGAELIRDPELAISNINVRDVDVILGVEFLISRRLWLSYGLSQLFLSRQ